MDPDLAAVGSAGQQFPGVHPLPAHAAEAFRIAFGENGDSAGKWAGPAGSVVEHGKLLIPRATDVAIAATVAAVGPDSDVHVEGLRHGKPDLVPDASERGLDHFRGRMMPAGPDVAQRAYLHEPAHPLGGLLELGLVESRAIAVPALDLVGGRSETDRVVDRGRTADAIALQYVEAEILRDLQHSPLVELADLS